MRSHASAASLPPPGRGVRGRTNCGRRRRFAFVIAAIAATATVSGHELEGVLPTWQTWNLEPGVVTSLFLAGALYVSGRRSWQRATGMKRRRRREAFYFYAGWLTLAVALLSPLHPLGQISFSLHMIQHELLMVVAAPLLILGRPLPVWLWAFPRRPVRTALARYRRAGGRWLTAWCQDPFAAFLAHALALWIGHVPAFFEATLHSEAWHALQHLSFFLTALLFWESVFFGRKRAAGYGLAVLMLFATATHSGVLGALIAFASRPLYPTYAQNGASWILPPAEDQQLGGLIMWIPAGLVYFGGALGLVCAWLRASARKSGRSATGTAHVPGMQAKASS